MAGEEHSLEQSWGPVKARSAIKGCPWKAAVNTRAPNLYLTSFLGDASDSSQDRGRAQDEACKSLGSAVLAPGYMLHCKPALGLSLSR